MRPAVVLCLALALLATACTPTRSGATARVTAGQVQRLDDGEWVGVTRIGEGDEIRVTADADLDFGGEVMRILAGSEATVGERGITLAVGDAMVEGTTLWLGLDQVTVNGSGAFRVQAGVTPRVAVYTGDVQVQRPGERQQIQSLRELGLSSRRFDGSDRPLSYDAGDPFDQRMLPAAIAFDAQITNLVNAIDSQFGAAPQPVAFYTSFISVSEPDLLALTSTAPEVTTDGSIGPPADALVGLFLARALADVRDGDLLRAGADIRRLRDEGARWGLVALALGVSSVDFATIVDGAVLRHDVAADGPAVHGASASTPSVPTGTGPAPGPAGAQGPTPDPHDRPEPAPPPPPPSEPPPTPVDADTVGEVLGDVLDRVPESLGLSGSSG